MNASSSDDDGVGVKVDSTSKERKRVVFGKVFASGKARSATTIFTKSAQPSPAVETAEETAVQKLPPERHLVRSRSEDIGPRVREEWAQEIWGSASLQESAVALRSSVADYEKEASAHQWGELIKVNADMMELSKLAESDQHKKAPKHGKHESMDGLSKFSTVALEYSKMLDVVMNQSPEYAGLAWGAIRMLLVAHTNHSKLKHSVEHYLIHFGQEFGVVNHLMNSHPTAKMVEAVSEAYTAFSKFLAKAVKFYKESKLMSTLKAFGFPWETRFQVLVSRIEAAFKRIKEIASAGHFGVTVQSQNMLRSIGAGQDQLRLDMKQDSIDLRQQLKLELKDEVQALFQTFDRNWISRFEQIMGSAQAALPAARGQSSQTLPAPSTTAAIEYAASMTEQGPMSPKLANSFPATFLADHVIRAKRLRRFRDKAFPLLEQLDEDEARLNTRLKHVTTGDLQQIMGLLQNESVRGWLQTSSSTFLWINTFRRSGLADWATAFAARIIEFACQIEHMTVLYHFCGNHPSSHSVSTPAVLLQSLIIQLLQLHHKRFTRKTFPFTLEHFSDARNDIEELWGLFMDCCAEANLPCIWLIIDNINNVQRGEDYETLLHSLADLSHEQSRIFKVFISARTAGAPNAIREAAEDAEQEETEQPTPRVQIVTVPRKHSRHTAALFSKQKRLSRLPEPTPDASHPQATKADIEKLLGSSEEDYLSSDKEDAVSPSAFVQSPTLMDSPQHMRKRSNGLASSESDSVSESPSDSSLEFTRDDPFASSEESDWEKSAAPVSKANGKPAKGATKGKEHNGYSEEDSEEDIFSFTKGEGQAVNEVNRDPDLMSTDEEEFDSDVVKALGRGKGLATAKETHKAFTKGPLDSEGSSSD